MVYEGVVILILDFPSRPPGTGQRRDVALGDAMGGGPGIPKDDAVIGIGGDKFKPVRHHRIVAIAQRHLIDIVEGVGEMLFADASRHDDGAEVVVVGEIGNPLVKRGMGFRLAGKKEIGLLFQYAPAMGLMAVQILSLIHI